MEENIRKLNLKIGGMSCSSCVNTIEKKLKNLQGIVSVSINIATEKGMVSYDENVLSEADILSSVDSAGYSATVELETTKEKVTFKVVGMTCSTCASKVEKTLNQTDGVESANVNFAVEKATVSYDPSQVKTADLEKTIDALGYGLVLEDERDDEIDDEEVKMQKARTKMVRSVMLSSIIMVIMMIHMFVTPIPLYLPIIAVLGFPIVFIMGGHVHAGSYKALRNKSPNMDVLVTLGSLPPYVIGLMGFFVDVQAFIEMATTIMTFHLIGKYLEVRAKGKASQAIKKLLEMGAKTARIIVEGEEKEVPVKDLQVDDVMVIRPGEKVPTDGVIIEGNGLLDESMATGESMPVKRKPGDELIGATINKQGMLKVKVTKVGKDTFLSQVIKMMEECQGSKVPIQEFADKVTGYFVPAIMIITVLTFVSFNLFPGFHYSIVEWGATFLPWINPNLDPLTLSFITATAVLVISCPCALGLGTPTALMVGSGLGAENGILIRNGEAIQTFKEVKSIAFDKTGTITKGKPEVTDIVLAKGGEMNDFLYLAGTIENGSEHPLAHAIVEKAKTKNVKIGDVKEFEAVVGGGVYGTIDDSTILIGTRKLMRNNTIDYADFENDLIRLEEEAKTAMLLAKDNKILGIIAVADPIKEDSARAISVLEKMGIKTAMITGDNSRTAAAIGKKVGITHVIAEVLPDGKVDEVKKLQAKYGTVAMVGDGINDAPALKQANVGVAIGTGTDIAIEAADVTLIKGELSGIITAVKLSRSIFRKIRENYFWAWIYNALFIPMAVLGLLHPLIGAATMAISSLNVVYNSLRLKKADIKPEYAQT